MQLCEQPSKVKSPTRRRTAQKSSPKLLQSRVVVHSLLTHFKSGAAVLGPHPPLWHNYSLQLGSYFFPTPLSKKEKKKKKGVKAFIILKTCQVRRRLCVSDACFLADLKSFAQLLGWRGQEMPAAAAGCELEL